jgi:hypothetical protein
MHHSEMRGCSRYREHVAGAIRRDRPRRHRPKSPQCGKRFRTRFLHDRGAMVLDCAPADSKIRGDVLAGMSFQDQIHDLVLPRRQIRPAIRELPLTCGLACSLCSIRNGRHSFEKQGLCPRQGASQSGFFEPVCGELAFEARDCPIDVVSERGVRVHAGVGHGSCGRHWIVLSEPRRKQRLVRAIGRLSMETIRARSSILCRSAHVGRFFL